MDRHSFALFCLLIHQLIIGHQRYTLSNKWSLLSPITIVFTAFVGFAGSVYVYRTIAYVVRRVSFNYVEHTRSQLRTCRMLLMVFVFVQVLLILSYVLSGVLLKNSLKGSLSFPLACMGSGIGIFALCSGFSSMSVYVVV